MSLLAKIERGGERERERERNIQKRKRFDFAEGMWKVRWKFLCEALQEYYRFSTGNYAWSL